MEQTIDIEEIDIEKVDNEKVDNEKVDNEKVDNEKVDNEKVGKKLLLACKEGNIDDVFSIISPHFYSSSSSSSSSSSYHVPPLNTFINYYCKKTFKTPLYVAHENGHDEIFKLLLLYGANACVSTNVQFVKRLIESNVDVNKTYGRKKETLLHIACGEGIEDTITYLLSVADINVNIKDRYKLICLHHLLLDYICISDDSEDKKHRLFNLLYKRCDLNCYDNRGFTLEECLDFDDYYLDKIVNHKRNIQKNLIN